VLESGKAWHYSNLVFALLGDGELLRVVRDDTGMPTKLYFATYPLTRAASTFGPSDSA